MRKSISTKASPCMTSRITYSGTLISACFYEYHTSLPRIVMSSLRSTGSMFWMKNALRGSSYGISTTSLIRTQLICYISLFNRP